MLSEQYMTHDEIYVSYRDAKDKKKQIQILSQLNCCSQDEIVEVLRNKGVTGKQLPRESKHRVECKAEKKTASKTTRDDVLDYIDDLKLKKKSLLDEVSKIDQELNIIQNKIVSGRYE